MENTAPTPDRKEAERRLRALVEIHKHEDMAYDERCELEDRIVKLRRTLAY